MGKCVEYFPFGRVSVQIGRYNSENALSMNERDLSYSSSYTMAYEGLWNIIVKSECEGSYIP